jgi:hypothetical protein
LPAICEAFGDKSRAQAAREFGTKLLRASVAKYWDPSRSLWINNLPWIGEEGSARMCDRSLATAVLYDQCPQGRAESVVRALADCPPEMGISYPANAGWRLWALGKGGRAEIIVKDLRERWATLDSVKLNNTLQENWTVKPDSNSEWSHCPVIPLYIPTMSLAGIRPLVPGFGRFEVRPQLADLDLLDVTVNSVKGPIEFSSRGRHGSRDLKLSVPEGCEGELVVDSRESLDLPAILNSAGPAHLTRYRLPAGNATSMHLKFT